ncbi:MAG TPA: histidine--tRNA ligase [Gemmatimonadaceae bacterium]|nr:histidine--tRNA ligase [Gemmatimonadaceae bacterium]
MPQAALPGFREFYPQELAERDYLMRIWRNVAHRFAFVEYDGPPLEPLELYTRKSGEEIVAQLYNFRDKGGREVALRPEMTPTFARMVAAKVQSLRKPVRWFSTPQLFRYERQQKGRLREHFQLNVDIVGEADVTADAELLAVAIAVMEQCGLSERDVVARISDRRLLNVFLAALGPAQLQEVAYTTLDKIRRESRTTLQERMADAGVADDVAREILSLGDLRTVADLRDWSAAHGSDPAAEEHIARLERYLALLDAHGASGWVAVDLSIVRGLAYYTGIVFELFDRAGKFRAICGGGRYDTLLAALGGDDLPALGFGMGDVVLLEMLRAHNLISVTPLELDYWIATEDNDLFSDVVRVATALRRNGSRVEYSLRRQPLARQLRTASSVGAGAVVILRRDRWPAGQLVVKRMSSGAEEQLSLDELLARQS